jgi:hypothetical protein
MDSNQRLCSAAPKEELRSAEKLAAGKLRQINGSPIELSIAMNRYYLDMNNRFLASHGKTWSAVGMNIYAGGWDTLVKRIGKHDSGWALDEKSYDASLIAPLLYGVRDFRCSCVKDSIPHQERRAAKLATDTFYDEVVASVAITPIGELLQKMKGNPSGCTNTTVDNTLILFALLCYCWLSAAP